MNETNKKTLSMLKQSIEYIKTVDSKRAAHHRSILITKIYHSKADLNSMIQQDLKKFDLECLNSLKDLDKSLKFLEENKIEEVEFKRSPGLNIKLLIKIIKSNPKNLLIEIYRKLNKSTDEYIYADQEVAKCLIGMCIDENENKSEWIGDIKHYKKMFDKEINTNSIYNLLEENGIKILLT